ncbi:YceI family protein [Martelella radicis]|uniref:Polyisoprenoid-binding protein YceI n=1 Tax=Martelella radicis TaxID=1397476 RepID=A0A7W6KHC3_9HYPH|nr:YceI family protein [Martelella radicis]MBB4121095.1 polyisoprenoid-binding protein YceI [Martelella radicis]
MKNLLLALLFALPANAAEEQAAPAGHYLSDPAHTSVTWRVSHFGLSNYTARFTGISADLEWVPDAPEQSALAVAIDPASVRTDFPFPEEEDFDGKIGTDPAFLAGTPISFVSERIEVDGDRTGKVYGVLTMRGETHPAVIDVTFNGSMAEHPMTKHAALGFSGVMAVKRSDWGFDFAVPVVSDTVEVLIQSEFKPAE